MSEHSFHFLVAIETDPTRYHGENPALPGLLSHSESEQMLAHVSADLQAMIPSVTKCSLASVGALFDQTQILRPGFPVFAALATLLPNSDPTERKSASPRLVSLGAEAGGFVLPDLMPEAEIPIGILQLLPLVISGPTDLVDTIGQEMEHRFLESGQLSPHSATFLEGAFGVAASHARFMTLTDLMAMFRMQLEHFGFLPLWELIDASLTPPSQQPLEVQTESGLNACWKDGIVSFEFESFNHWAGMGAGAGRQASKQLLSAGYADWTRDFRRFVNTLAAHRVATRIIAPRATTTGGERGQIQLRESYCVETPAPLSGDSWASVTEHSHSDLGTVAVTLAMDPPLNGAADSPPNSPPEATARKVAHYFPLKPEGLNDIHRAIRTILGNGSERPVVAFPGGIVYDELRRALLPDRR